MYRQIDQVLTDAQDAHILGAAFLSNWLLDEVSPPDETALARQFFSPSSEGVRTSQLGPTMTGPTKTEDRRGMILHAKRSYRRDREFSRRREAPRTQREQ